MRQHLNAPKNTTIRTIVVISIFLPLISRTSASQKPSLVEDDGGGTTKRDARRQVISDGGGQATGGGGDGCDAHANGKNEHHCEPENKRVIINTIIRICIFFE